MIDMDATSMFRSMHTANLRGGFVAYSDHNVERLLTIWFLCLRALVVGRSGVTDRAERTVSRSAGERSSGAGVGIPVGIPVCGADIGRSVRFGLSVCSLRTHGHCGTHGRSTSENIDHQWQLIRTRTINPPLFKQISTVLRNLVSSTF